MTVNSCQCLKKDLRFLLLVFRATSMQGWHITIPLNLCKQCGANLEVVGPNPHTPYVDANHEIDQLQVSLLNAYDKIPSKV
jgi:hypothetical protein